MTSTNTLRGPRTRLERMSAAPGRVSTARLMALTPAQMAARSHGLELTADEAEFYVHSERYARTLFEMDRDVWAGWARADAEAERREYREHVRDQIHTFTGRMSRTLVRRRLERPRPEPCPF